MGALLAQNLQLSVVGRMMWAMTTSSRNRSKFDSRTDSGFAYLRARTLPQLLAILGASVIAPWGLFAVTPTPSNGLPPILELLYLSPIVAVLALVIPRFPLGRERILLVGIYAALVNYALADFAYMYWSMSQRSPGSFSEPLSHIDAAYFALGSFTTAGSSISALSADARAMATAQLALGFGAVVVGAALVLGSRRPAASAAQPSESSRAANQ